MMVAGKDYIVRAKRPSHQRAERERVVSKPEPAKPTKKLRRRRARYFGEDVFFG